MKKILKAMAVIMLVALCGCGKNKKTKEVQPVRVKVEQVKAVAVNGEQGFSGTIEEQSGVALSFSTPGTIKRIYVSEGQMVGKNQLIAELDPTIMGNSVTAAQATTNQAHDMVEQAKATYAQAKDAYDRLKLLHDNGSLPEIQWIEAMTNLRQAETMLRSAQSGVKSASAMEKIANKELSDTRLYAPFSGYISAKSSEIGQSAAPGMPVVKLVDISRVKVKIAVPEDEVGRISKGTQMMVRVPALGSRSFYGQVTEKGVSADPRSRTYEVKATIPNGDRQLLPGMICQAFTNYMQGATGVFVPANLVQLDSDNKTFVWVVNGDKAVKRQIFIDGETSQGAKVSQGLADGDQLIVSGQQKVSNGMKVEVVK